MVPLGKGSKMVSNVWKLSNFSFAALFLMLQAASPCHAQTLAKPVVTGTNQSIICESAPRIFPKSPKKIALSLGGKITR